MKGETIGGTEATLSSSDLVRISRRRAIIRDRSAAQATSLMITNVPTSDDFQHAGIAYLNLAWDAALTLALKLDEAILDERDLDNYDDTELESWEDLDIPDEYWNAAQRPLATATTLLQQGTEFLLKAKIALVSPYLLMAKSPADWPRGCNRGDISFSAFKTIDSQDLVRTHDTVANSRLTDSFVDRFERLRKIRNTIMHTVDRGIRFSAADVIIAVLETSEELIGPQKWVELRESFLMEQPDAIAYSADFVQPALARECRHVIAMLQPALLRRFFGFNKRQRSYYCYNCWFACRDTNLDVMTAQLTPNTPTATDVYCFVCRQTSKVARQQCLKSECNGNVMDAVDGVCLTCFQ